MNPVLGGVVQMIKMFVAAVVAVVSFVVQPFVGPAQPQIVPLNQANMPPVVETVTVTTSPYHDHESPIVVGSAGQTLYIHGTAQDMNGCQTITAATLEFYPTTTGGCSGSASCIVVSSPTLDQCSTGGTRARYQFVLSVTPPSAPQGWTAQVVANDGNAVGGNSDEVTLQPGTGGPFISGTPGPTTSPAFAPLFTSATPLPSTSIAATAMPVPTSTSSSGTGPSYLTLPAPTATP